MNLARIEKNNQNHLSVGPYHFIEEIDRMFDDFLGVRRGEESPLFRAAWAPVVDIGEKQDAYVLKAELPGLKKDDVKITLEDNVLTLSGEKKSETVTNGEKVHRVERSYGAFRRSFALPVAVKAEKISAAYKDGVLEVIVPKSEESKPREIEVKVT